jgi:hypothetical protein
VLYRTIINDLPKLTFFQKLICLDCDFVLVIDLYRLCDTRRHTNGYYRQCSEADVHTKIDFL